MWQSKHHLTSLLLIIVAAALSCLAYRILSIRSDNHRNIPEISETGLESGIITLALFKPDLVGRSLDKEVLEFLLETNFEVIAYHPFEMTKEFASLFYAEHIGKSFFPELVTYMTSGPTIALILKGEDAVRTWRNLMVSLRQVYGIDTTRNSFHGSDSIGAAAREIELIFNKYKQSEPEP